MLFTDIVDSTGQLEQSGDQVWARVLDALDSVTRSESRRRGVRWRQVDGDRGLGAAAQSDGRRGVRDGAARWRRTARRHPPSRRSHRGGRAQGQGRRGDRGARRRATHCQGGGGGDTRVRERARLGDGAGCAVRRAGRSSTSKASPSRSARSRSVPSRQHRSPWLRRRPMWARSPGSWTDSGRGGSGAGRVGRSARSSSRYLSRPAGASSSWTSTSRWSGCCRPPGASALGRRHRSLADCREAGLRAARVPRDRGGAARATRRRHRSGRRR